MLVTLKPYLYFDPVRRSAEHVALDVSLKESRDELARMVAEKETVDSIAQLKREFPMFTFDIDAEKHVLTGFEEDSEKIASARQRNSSSRPLPYRRKKRMPL